MPEQSPNIKNDNGLVGDSGFQTVALENLAETPHYQDWLSSLVEPYLGDDPLELGSGTGDYANLWLERGCARITVTEIDPDRRAILENRFAGDDRVVVTSIKPGDTGTYSSMFSFNVLEHIEDDHAMLEAAHGLLRPGGYVFHLVPAFPFAMSRFDRDLGHFRRYRRVPLAKAAREAGLIVEDVRYLNAPGLIAWFVMMRLLKGEPSPGVMLRLWDSKVIPAERWLESKIRVPFGQSVVLMARKPG